MNTNTTLEDLRALCAMGRRQLHISTDGSLALDGIPISQQELKEIAAGKGGLLQFAGLVTNPKPTTLDAAGYERLAEVLAAAFSQASEGKGKERHANDLPFHEQPMQQIARRRGVGFILGQADKKTQEAQGMLERGQHDAWEREMLGAIVYLAGAVIFAQDQRQPVRVNAVTVTGGSVNPANDNTPCCAGGHQTDARCTGCAESAGLRAERKN